MKDAPEASGSEARLRLRARALSTWENEGGARAEGSAEPLAGPWDPAAEPPLSNAELVQLRIRVIALENLLIALLAEASESQRQLVLDMADYISPRPGFTPHPMTLHAAAQMVGMIERARHFSEPPGE
jgi:hypothetical protein